MDTHKYYLYHLRSPIRQGQTVYAPRGGSLYVYTDIHIYIVTNRFMAPVGRLLNTSGYGSLALSGEDGKDQN